MSKVIDLEETRKKIRKRNIIIYLIFVSAVIYITYAIYLIVKNPTDTVTIDTGVLTSEESTTGYIIRDETVIQGKNYKNGIYQLVAEGERAAKNQNIFRYYGNNEEELEQKIEEINLKIQEALANEKGSSSSDVKNIDEQIAKKTDQLTELTDVQKITEIKKEIADLIIKKSNIAGELSPSGSYIKKLTQQREEYENQLTTGSEIVKATKSGVVSYRVDGLENVLTTDDFSNLTEQSLKDLDLKTGKIISTNNECAKIINNFECYIAVILDSNVAKNAKEGDSVKITLSSGNDVTATISYIKKQESGNMLIVFKTNTLTEELISYRKISLNITWWSYSGMKVPNDAIAEDSDGLKYVIKKTTSGTSKILIKVLKTNDKYSIISNYSAEDLNALEIDIATYEDIDVYDTVMLYP